MKVSGAAKGRTLPKGACTASGHGHGVTAPIKVTLAARVIRSNFKCLEGVATTLNISSADGIAVFSL